MTEPVYVDLIPRLVVGIRNTDVLILYRERFFYTRHNYALPPTPANRDAEVRAFLARRSVTIVDIS